jgi:uncharacterized protein
MIQNIIGREWHIQEMNDALATKKPEFMALTGRRRVGKTYLISQVYGKQIDFELTGLHKGNKKEQLENFVMMMEKYFPSKTKYKKPKTWLSAFKLLGDALDKKKKKSKLVVFIDELPWLATKRSGFLTALSWFWNTWATKRNVLVIICGSAASWMIDNVIGDKGGLHNRVTRLLKLEPFNLFETEKFLHSKNVKLNRYQITQLYMTIGGIPMYLDMIKKNISAVQNIQALCFNTEGFLKTEFDRLFASLFDNYGTHVNIVETLAKKKMGMTRQELIEKSKMSNGGMLTKVLNELKHSGFIEEYGCLGKIEKDSLFRLVDAYSLFYLTYIQKLTKTAKYTFTNFNDLVSWKIWTGYAFENVCFAHINQIKMALSINGISSSIASFIAKPKEGLSGTQIDLLIDRNDNCMNVCEMKFASSNYTITKADVKNIDSKKEVLIYHSKTKKHLFTTLVTTHAISDNEYKLNYINQVILLDDLFKKEA